MTTPAGGFYCRNVVRRLKKINAKVGNKNPVTVQEIVNAINDTLNFIQTQHNRFIVPDDFMEDHPEREKMVTYLQGKSWRGTESGGARLAKDILT